MSAFDAGQNRGDVAVLADRGRTPAAGLQGETGKTPLDRRGRQGAGAVIRGRAMGDVEADEFGDGGRSSATRIRHQRV